MNSLLAAAAVAASSTTPEAIENFIMPVRSMEKETEEWRKGRKKGKERNEGNRGKDDLINPQKIHTLEPGGRGR